MKKITLFLLLSAILPLSAISQKTTFIRVYDSIGAKIAKGNFKSITDTSLTLTHKRKDITIPLHNIARIRTKRSVGHNILILSLIGGTIGGFMGGAIASTPGGSGNVFGGVAIGALPGGYAGAALGGLSWLIKGSRKFDINGDAAQWQAFKEFMKARPTYSQMQAPETN